MPLQAFRSPHPYCVRWEIAFRDIAEIPAEALTLSQWKVQKKFTNAESLFPIFSVSVRPRGSALL
jgi:hypothetical protein